MIFKVVKVDESRPVHLVQPPTTKHIQTFDVMLGSLAIRLQ
jgi:hypothetical protein